MTEYDLLNKQTQLINKQMNYQDKTKEELITELTERVLIEKKLKQSLKNWQATFDAIDDFLVLINTKLEIIGINKAGQLSLGKEQHEIIGKKCHSIIHQTDTPIPECPCVEALQKNRTIINEYKKNNKVYELSAWPVFDETKKITSLTHIIKDITIRKESELMIKKQYQELQELNATKDKFFSIIAHDLRSPLITVFGFAELVKDKEDNNDSKKTEQYIDIIHLESKRAIELIDDILTWSITQKGKINIMLERINITELLNEEIEKLKTNASQKGITINHMTNLPIDVYADSNMLRTVLRNLISNGIKFTNEKGKIEINVIKLQNYVEISVGDNGVGITEENISKLFRIDESISTICTANEKGTGLGLIISKEFVEKNGGKIWVESKHGNGCNFKFTLPLCEN